MTKAKVPSALTNDEVGGQGIDQNYNVYIDGMKVQGITAYNINEGWLERWEMIDARYVVDGVAQKIGRLEGVITVEAKAS